MKIKFALPKSCMSTKKNASLNVKLDHYNKAKNMHNKLLQNHIEFYYHNKRQEKTLYEISAKHIFKKKVPYFLQLFLYERLVSNICVTYS